MISITTAIFFLLPSLFGTAGAAGVWLWIPCAAGVFLIVLVYAHLAARIPITGYAYQWNSRLINPHYGWFTGYTALLAFIAGTAATGAALLPMYCFIGWEGAADLAEETNDPRSVTPFAMIRANYVSVAASLFMIVGFLIAIPNGTAALLSQPKNPLVYIFQSHFGAVAA